MTISHVIAPNPYWSVIDNVGLLAGGAKLYTKSSRNPSIDKAAYQDAAGTNAYTNPIIFDANGTKPPIYWRLDSDDPGDLYYIEARDSDNTFLWSINSWPQGVGSGGGGTDVTTYISLQNYITNGVFQDHTDDTASPIAQQHTKIAPSNHKGFTPAESNPIVSNTQGIVAPDIWFTKSNTNANDQITYPEFTLGDTFTNDVCPVFYLRYVCTNTPLGETYKCFQFPIVQKVQNLTNQRMTFQIWAKAAAPVSLTLYVRQYFGSAAGASAAIRTTISPTLDLTTSWQEFNVPFTVPSVGGKTTGAVGLQTDDDALYLQLEMPLGVACDISMTKATLHLGELSTADQDFEIYDQIDAITQTPRTGDIRLGYSASAPQGWVACNTSIGNTGSGATRFNKDTFQLYALLYTNVSDSYAVVATGRTGTTVADAVTDFIANKKMTLMPVLGRAIAAAGAGSGLSVRALGQFLGDETILMADMPLHDHTGSTVAAGVGAGITGFAEALATGPTHPVTVAPQGGGVLNTSGQAGGKMQPTAFMNVFLKL